MSYPFLRRLLAFLGVLGFFAPALVRAQVAVTPGDLIKGTSSPTVYYYGPGNTRYVFPNEKTFFTWYSNFTNVVTVSDSQLANMAIAGNVTYRPGVRLVKIQSDPKVYAVSQGGVLHWVTSEALASSLYGSSWNTQDVDDIPVSFFTNYTVGAPVSVVADYSPNVQMAVVPTILIDKNLSSTNSQTPVVTTAPSVSVSIANMTSGFSPSALTVNLGTQVTWTNSDSVPHTVTSDSGLFDSGTLQPGQSFTYTFTNAGTFTYHDAIHPTIQGSVVVLSTTSTGTSSTTTSTSSTAATSSSTPGTM